MPPINERRGQHHRPCKSADAEGNDQRDADRDEHEDRERESGFERGLGKLSPGAPGSALRPDLALELVDALLDRLRIAFVLVAVRAHRGQPSLVLLPLAQQVLEPALPRTPRRAQSEEEKAAEHGRDDHDAEPEHEEIVPWDERDGTVGRNVGLVEPQPQNRAADDVEQADRPADERGDRRGLAEHALEPARGIRLVRHGQRHRAHEPLIPEIERLTRRPTMPETGTMRPLWCRGVPCDTTPPGVDQVKIG